MLVECSLWEQDCQPDQKCVPWAQDGGEVWDGARCVPLDPEPVAAGEACVVEEGPTSGFDDCGPGTICWDVDPETHAGTCRHLCTQSPDEPLCPDPATSCVQGNGGIINVCAESCDPLLQDCPRGSGCYGFLADEVFTCLRTGTPVFTADGLQPADCAPGFNGVDPSVLSSCEPGAQCCAEWCDLQQLRSCADDRVCVESFPSGNSFRFPPGICVDP